MQLLGLNLANKKIPCKALRSNILAVALETDFATFSGTFAIDEKAKRFQLELESSLKDPNFPQLAFPSILPSIGGRECVVSILKYTHSDTYVEAQDCTTGHIIFPDSHTLGIIVSSLQKAIADMIDEEDIVNLLLNQSKIALFNRQVKALEGKLTASTKAVQDFLSLKPPGLVNISL